MEQKYVMAAIDAALKAGEKILSIYPKIRNYHPIHD